MYIRRKVFSLLQDETGEEKYYSTTDVTLDNLEERIFSISIPTEEELEQREFGARQRKQNRKLARSIHNAEMQANKAAKAQEKAAKIVSNPANLVDEKKMEEAQKLTKKAQKAVESSNRNAGQASQQVKNISKTRKSVATNPRGLEIKNQGAGDMIVKKEGGNVTAHKIAPKKSGQIFTTVRTTSTKPDVVVDKLTSKGYKKVSTEAVKKSAEKTQKVAEVAQKTQKVAEVAQKTTKDSKKILNVAKKLMNTKAGKIAGGVALASGAMIGAKKLYDHKKK